MSPANDTLAAPPASTAVMNGTRRRMRDLQSGKWRPKPSFAQRAAIVTRVASGDVSHNFHARPRHVGRIRHPVALARRLPQQPLSLASATDHALQSPRKGWRNCVINQPKCRSRRPRVGYHERSLSLSLFGRFCRRRRFPFEYPEALANAEASREALLWRRLGTFGYVRVPALRPLLSPLHAAR